MPRPKGIPNRKTQALADKAKELGVDPFEILLMFAKADWKGLGYPSEKRTVVSMGKEFEIDVIEPEMRVTAAKEACQYMHPKRKAIEVSGDAENPINYVFLGEEDVLPSSSPAQEADPAPGSTLEEP